MESPKEPEVWKVYLPVEVFGGNAISVGVGCAFLDRTWDVQIQGAYAYYEREDYASVTDDYSTWGYTFGTDISRHHFIKDGPWGYYYGLLYRYNHVEESDFADFNDIHWTGLSLGGELQKEKLTFYVENLWFLRNLYWDIPYTSLALGVKVWL